MNLVEPPLKCHRPTAGRAISESKCSTLQGDEISTRLCWHMKKSKSEIDKYIGSRIREGRLLLQLSQGLLARALGVTFQQVQNYEKGANGISAVRLFDICRILNVPLNSMFPPAGSKRLPDIIGRRIHGVSWKMKARHPQIARSVRKKDRTDSFPGSPCL